MYYAEFAGSSIFWLQNDDVLNLVKWWNNPEYYLFC
jgi:hypothetical protein